MKKKIKRRLALAAAVLGILSAWGVPAAAYTDETVQEEAPAETEAPIPETEAETEATPFSIPGNGQILDDKQNDGTKQFVTVQTKSGSTFFLVLDRSSNTENAYMLSMIDENDLEEFLGERKEPETEPVQPQVLVPETEPAPVETEPADVPETTEIDGEKLAVLAACLLFLILIGVIYYYKVVKPKKAEGGSAGEGLELYDGGEDISEE